MKNPKALLPALLVQIAANHNRPLSLAAFVQLVNEAGYKPTTKSVATVVMVAIQKLLERNTFSRDESTGKYHLTHDSHSASESEKP